jgi:hypothetical protein
MLKGHAIFAVVLPYQLRKDYVASWPPTELQAQHEIASSAGCAAVPVNERLNIVEPPQNLGCKQDGIHIVPMPVHPVNKVVHQRGDTIVLRRAMLADDDGAGPIFPSIDVQAL